jgi:hypothetical protein
LFGVPEVLPVTERAEGVVEPILLTPALPLFVAFATKSVKSV